MDRRRFLRGTTAVVALAAADPAAAALRDDPGTSISGARIPRIGVLGESNPLSWIFRSEAFELECRWADESRRRLGDLATELVAREVDVIVAVGGPAARAAANVTRTTPIVFVSDADPLGPGLVRNVTGLSVPSDAQRAAQRLALLREAVPGLTRLGVLRNPDNALHEAALVATRRAADRHGVELWVADARVAGRLVGALTAMADARVDAFIVLPDTLFSLHADGLVTQAQVSRLPGIYPARSFADAGGLMALHGNSAEVIKRVSKLVRRILEGVSVAPLPVQHLDDLELTINLRSAATLDLDVPPSLLARADSIIHR